VAEQILIIPKTTDRSLIEYIKKILLFLEKHDPKVNLTILGGVDLNFDRTTFDTNNNIKALSDNNLTLFYHFTIHANGTNVNYYRGGAKEQKSPFTDELRINLDQSKLNRDEKINFVLFLTAELRVFDPNYSLSGPITKEQSELAAIHESTLNRLELLNEKLIEETHNYRKTLDKEFSEKEVQLQEKYEEIEKNLNGKYQDRLDDIYLRENELEKNKKELDDKSNTHARRQIRKDILSEIKNRQKEFKLTQGTNRLRWPIALAMLSLIALFVGLSITSIQNFDFVLESRELNKEANNVNYLLLIGAKQILYSAGAVASFLYYIRWNNRWFEQHSIAEFQLKQFELDMERASWIVETSLEWKDAKGTAIPSDLLNSLSKNLFSEAHEKIDPLVHPADQLASALLGSASMIKLKAGDSEIQIDPKKLEKAKSAEE
jgi:hypothetical protein